MNLEDISEKICDILISSAYIVEANEINSLMNKVLEFDGSDPIRMSAIDNLISRCHPKWLGDYYINNVSYKEWTDLITDFKKHLSKAK